MSVSRVLQNIKSTARKRPLLFNCAIYGSFYTGAEFVQQTYSRMFKFSLPASSTMAEESELPQGQRSLFAWSTKSKDGEDSSMQLRSYNWTQLKRYAIYGCFVAGPILHGWYKWLDVFYKGNAMKTVLLKVLIDQLILTPPLIVVFFISMSLMEGKQNVFDECRAKFWQTFKTSCLYWLPVQFFNFRVIPSTFRVSFVSIAAFCWVNILCYLKSRPTPELSNNSQIKY